jgi:hypothetical protein
LLWRNTFVTTVQINNKNIFSTPKVPSMLFPVHMTISSWPKGNRLLLFFMPCYFSIPKHAV